MKKIYCRKDQMNQNSDAFAAADTQCMKSILFLLKKMARSPLKKEECKRYISKMSRDDHSYKSVSRSGASQ